MFKHAARWIFWLLVIPLDDSRHVCVLVSLICEQPTDYSVQHVACGMRQVAFLLPVLLLPLLLLLQAGHGVPSKLFPIYDMFTDHYMYSYWYVYGGVYGPLEGESMYSLCAMPLIVVH